jgi:outer membrane autotransporter protein
MLGGSYVIEPRAEISYVHVGQAGFNETGADMFDLTYAQTNTGQTSLRAAVRVSRSFPVQGWQVTPWSEAGILEAVSGLSRSVCVADGPYAVTAAGVSPTPTAATIGLGVDIAASDHLDGYARYTATFSANQISNSVELGGRYRF